MVLVNVSSYHQGELVKTSVECLLAVGYRLVVVDDSSLDDTTEVRHSPIDYLRHTF
jgi:hypothetical protein